MPLGAILLIMKEITFPCVCLSGIETIYSLNIANFSWVLVLVSFLENAIWRPLFLKCFIGGLLSFLIVIIYLKVSKAISFILLKEQIIHELKKWVHYKKVLTISEVKFSNLFIAAPIPVSYIRLFDRTLVDVNPAFEKLFGFSKNDILEKTTFELGLWASRDNWNNFYNIFTNQGEVNYFEAEVKAKNGDVKTCLISGNRVHLQEQDYIYAFFQDITERKKAELALKSSELKYREVFNSVSEAFFIYDLETESLLDANKKATETYKYSLEEFKKMSFVELASNEYPYTHRKLRKWLTNSLKEDGSSLTEWRVKGKDGKVLWVEISVKKTTIDNRKSILSLTRDISERKKTEKLLIENEFLFRFQFNNSNLGIVISSTDNIFIKVNKKYCDILGYTEDELQGRSWTEFTYPEDLNISTYQSNQLLTGEIDGYENDKRYIRKDGSIANVHVSVSCFRNHDKTIHYIIAYIFDVTDRVEMENKILKTIIETEESERTRFAQELHDGLGPLLSSIKMYTQWMLKPGANLNQREALLQIENLVIMSNQLVREIAFGLSPQILKNFGLIEALKAFIDKIKVDKNLPVEIKGDLEYRLDETTETVIYRVLIECINNSLKHSQADLIKIDFKETSKYLNIEFQDNGIGFDLNEVTDKRHGMGINNIQNRLKSINGKLLISSKFGKGTLIKINILYDKNSTR